jgi:lysophospholipase L1-like esterase
MKKLKRLALILIINVVILLPLIYGFEFLLERKDPKKNLPVNGMVNGKFVTWGHLVENNRFDFRERDFAVPKPPGVFRIMILGDSLTWGAGLAPEERYGNLLEKSLNDAYPPRKFEVLNFGILGGPTTEERDVLRRYKDLVQPDLIVVGYCINDPQPKSQDYSVERERFEAKTARTITSLKYRLGQVGLPAIAELIKNAAYGFAEKTNMMPPWEAALDRTYVKSSVEWQEFLKALGEIKQMSDEMKLPAPIFVALNQGGKTGSDYVKPDEMISYFIKWTRAAEQAANEVGFKTLDYEKEIPVELANDSMVINVLDGHPSAKLNQLYAKKLLGVVVADAGLNGERTQPGH